ncbi:hypothetical protein ACFQBY_00765 [Promicromonospora citrea]|uniref:hypothetical protein n=1 Tax=Promicromonospora citrea TaxID=43677 RepID=UPI00148891E9|nr:hypothetical protein [Promicromonospora citrea]NNH51539.1 hypothetical protein [Promicromonospora citrea]
MLVREAAQNSWDARTDEAGVDVHFGLDLYTVGAAHANTWRALLLEGCPRNAEHFPLRTSLGRNSIRVLAVSDRGTKGLGGPTRADAVTDGPRDFVTFVRNVGEPRDTQLGGGTYGFGKGIFFMLSRAHTVLIHTRTRHQGRLQTRLIGSALAHSYTESVVGRGEARYTGRHWWGMVSEGLVEPLVDAEADEMAERLGLAPFGADETGTTVVVVDPEIDEDLGSPGDVGDYLAETILWQLWPKMLPRVDGRPAMTFHVTVDGQDHPVPDPALTHPVQMFVEAYRRMNGPESRQLASGRPKRLLGVLGLHDTFVLPWTLTRAAESAGFDDTLVHHVCLMRSAELVVTYAKGVKPQAELKGYAGVFRVDPSMDEVFARAEPPTHDAWNADSLPPDERRYVKAVTRRLTEAQQEISGLRVVVGSEGREMALGAASNYFSDLVRGSSGFGGRHAAFESRTRDDNDPRTTGRTLASRPGRTQAPAHAIAAQTLPRVRVEYVGDPFHTHHHDRPALVQEFKLTGEATVRLDARLSIATSIDATGRDRDGTDQPQPLGWVTPDGTTILGPSALVRNDGHGTWRLLVRPTEDTMTVVEIEAEAVRP